MHESEHSGHEDNQLCGYRERTHRQRPRP